AGFGIDDEPIDVSEFLVGTVAYKHVVDVQGLIVNLVCFDVSQPRLWMIHGFSPICAMRGKSESKTRASPRPATLIHNRVPRHPCRLQYCTARSCFSAAARVLNVPRFRRRPVLGGTGGGFGDFRLSLTFE